MRQARRGGRVRLTHGDLQELGVHLEPVEITIDPKGLRYLLGSARLNVSGVANDGPLRVKLTCHATHYKAIFVPSKSIQEQRPEVEIKRFDLRAYSYDGARAIAWKQMEKKFQYRNFGHDSDLHILECKQDGSYQTKAGQYIKEIEDHIAEFGGRS